MFFHYAIGFISLISLALSQRATVCDEAGPYTFLPDVNDCSGWFFCGDNGPERGVCPAGRLFNPETRLCDFPHNVDCFRCPSNEGFNHFAMSGSCRSFVRCINGMPFQSVCEDRLQFNEKTGQCDFPDTVNCGSGFRCPSELPIDGTILAMRDNYNCSVYHLCIGRTQALRQECNSELHFDSLTNLCTFPELTFCPIRQYPGGPGLGPGNTDSDSTTVAPTTISTSTVFSTITTTEDTTESTTTGSTRPLFKCPFDGIHPHPTECTEYFVCAANVSHLMRCAHGLHFNAATLQCDFAQNAQCDLYSNYI